MSEQDGGQQIDRRVSRWMVAIRHRAVKTESVPQRATAVPTPNPHSSRHPLALVRGRKTADNRGSVDGNPNSVLGGLEERMNPEAVGLLELGSNSLKFYVVRPLPDGSHSVDTRKTPWRVAHVFYESGQLSPDAEAEFFQAHRDVVRACDELGLSSRPFCMATGVFREIPDLPRLSNRLLEELRIRLRVISGEDEARLMARGYRAPRDQVVVVADLGGATTEWARFERGKARACGSLRLGAIRLHRELGVHATNPDVYLGDARRICDGVLASLDVPDRASLLVSGGTARAMAEVAGREKLSLAELDRLIGDALRAGSPAGLDPARSEVFLPGLVILANFARRIGSETIEYAKTSVQEGMAQRLVALLSTTPAQDLHATLLLHTRVPD
jgi:exopolyphosphatase/guanosine-5'-triphosphate,3'-diphosphate pyrophosphatase